MDFVNNLEVAEAAAREHRSAENTRQVHAARDAVPWWIRFWGSDPELDNDDLQEELPFNDEISARAAWRRLEVPEHCAGLTTHAELTGPGVEEVVELPGADAIRRRRAREAAEDQEEWRREMAMQAGMAGGCDAYNDVMGYELGPDED